MIPGGVSVVRSFLAPLRRNLRADADRGVAPGGVFAFFAGSAPPPMPPPPPSFASCSWSRVSKSLCGAPVTGTSSRSIAVDDDGRSVTTGGGGCGASRSGGSLDGDGGVTFGRFRLSISVMGARCASGFTCSQVTETRIPASSASDAPARDARSPRGILFFFLPADDGLSCIGARPSDDSLRAGGERGVGRCGLAGSASGAFAVVNSILNLSAISLERRGGISRTAPVPMRVSASIGMWEGWSHLTDIVDMVVSAVLLCVHWRLELAVGPFV